MEESVHAFREAAWLLFSGDADLWEIVWLTLRVSLTAVAMAALVGLPLAGVLALYRFPGRRAVVVGLNALMGLPPVVAGLVVYLALSRSGPLGGRGLLFTPTAMVVAPFGWVPPSVTAPSRPALEGASMAQGGRLGPRGGVPAPGISSTSPD